MATDPCTCPVPFTEDDLICDSCMEAEQASWLKIHDASPMNESEWAEYASRQG